MSALLPPRSPLAGGRSASLMKRWLLLTAVALVAAGLAPTDVIVKNQPLTVSLGRSVFLSPSEDLRIRVAPGDRCDVQVVQAEDGEPASILSWSRPGRLQPASFPCGFGFGTVSYTHFGSRITPLLDRVRLLVKYEAEDETLIVPLLLSVEVSPEPYQIAVKVNALSVPSIGGETEPISEDVLTFSGVEPGSVCRVRVLTEVHRLPRHGELVGDVPTQFTSCESLLRGDVRYRHTGGSHSFKWDYVPFLVEVTDSSGHSSRKERFHLPIKIEAGIENSAPQPTFASELRLDVSQFIMTPLTPAVLAADDPDSDSGTLLFNFRTVLGPGEGHFVTTDDRRVPTTSFFQKDVQALKIAYVPPLAQSNDSRVFRVEVEVVDPDGATSDPFSLMIVVKPTNTMAPLVTKNTGITLIEGKSRKIGGSLAISDQDNREDVLFTVVDGMRHGSLLVDGEEADMFTIADLDEGRVAYRHDGSSTSTDNVVFKVSDGRHDVEFLFPVTIYPVDDEPPLLDINTGITIHKGEDAQVLSRYLSATDVDSDDFGILFELLPPFPEHGTLLVKKHEKPPNSFHWLFKDGLYEAEVTKWEQVDLLEGNLYYRYSGDHVSEPITDRVFFQLSDENEPPNESGINEFLVRILPVDDLPPEKHPDATLHLLVEEFQLTVITKKELRYRDLDTKEKELRCRITRPPFDTDASNAMSAGSVVRMDEPDTDVTEFTQAEVNHHKIGYRPPSAELGIVPRIINFEFEVRDNGDNVIGGQAFTVLLQPVDNKPPAVHNRGITVTEKSSVEITLEDLDAIDTDTPSEELTFVVLKVPAYGAIRLGGDVLDENDFFKCSDIASGQLSYENMGTSGRKMDKFELEITPKNDEMPEITIDEITGSEGSDISLEEIVTQAADMDRPSDKLTFRVTKPPLHGKVLSTRTMQLETFDSDDVAAPSFVVYRHDDSETTSDSFELSVSDGQHESRKQISVIVTPVDDETPRLVVNDGLEVGLEEKKAITNRVLRAEDIDSDDSSLTYILRDVPRHGRLQLLNSSTYQPSRNLTLASNFTQQDIDNGLILYTHTGAPGVRDLIRLDVTDGTNSLIDQYFWVTIESIDVVYPEVVNRGVRLPEGGKVTLTTASLSTTDLNSDDERLRFAITQSPGKGHLESSDAPGVIIRSFTQLDLAGNKISYVHTSKDESKLDSFEFEVSDGRNSVFRTFRIAITDVDNKKPVVFISPLRLREGTERLITPFELKADDMDTPDRSVRFRIIHRPLHGRIIIDRSREATSFTMADLGDNRLSYSHDGSDTKRDNFTFVVSDGVHDDFYVHPNVQQPTREPQLFPVEVVAVDNSPPQVAVNRGAFALSYLDGSRRLGFRFDSDVLRACDSDSVAARLKYVVTVFPSHGILVNRAVGNRSVVEFTQGPEDKESGAEGPANQSGGSTQVGRQSPSATARAL
ncbi:hypothetical protein HPB52_023610 [Rhipicephalus sanguineus]|uniref:FRAS1-related extracellular matrix protein N-terminal domain-containing protein n=1 Tax=Rhipicephalus sanguineus TaxID=34632 RepID=A0A9D4Q8R3_RHISA|nr:hypothetical protein HPB52_023610 [Rhipicephalus sanguineus]